MGGGQRRRLLLGFGLALLFGMAIYFRLWVIDSSFSLDDREALRKQFDRANMEAMDESAEWRMKYDRELEISRQYQLEITEIKDALSDSKKKIVTLQEENTGLEMQVESLKRKLEAMEQHCKCN
ncbi:Myosin rod fragments domain-containing protein [Dioscorea alata]|uniref:Myosin rods domain-containing protein n=1 Tax=Dioscorea alata TaxID=55571 RepID=A0ACB7V8W4_DIOAL|nr:Myosin rod fragments domain-containing protein [Dioscorea alata]